jgi:hypothetical protein
MPYIRSNDGLARPVMSVSHLLTSCAGAECLPRRPPGRSSTLVRQVAGNAAVRRATTGNRPMRAGCAGGASIPEDRDKFSGLAPKLWQQASVSHHETPRGLFWCRVSAIGRRDSDGHRWCGCWQLNARCTRIVERRSINQPSSQTTSKVPARTPSNGRKHRLP